MRNPRWNINLTYRSVETNEDVSRIIHKNLSARAGKSVARPEVESFLSFPETSHPVVRRPISLALDNFSQAARSERHVSYETARIRLRESVALTLEEFAARDSPGEHAQCVHAGVVR